MDAIYRIIEQDFNNKLYRVDSVDGIYAIYLSLRRRKIKAHIKQDVLNGIAILYLQIKISDKVYRLYNNVGKIVIIKELNSKENKTSDSETRLIYK